MTISVAWIRTLRGGAEELIFAADSRLTGGYQWDTAQKIFVLPGLNALMSFAGPTELALPVMQQVLTSCSNYPPSRDGAWDLDKARIHITKIINTMIADFRLSVPGLVLEMAQKTSFILGGFSHSKRALVLWRLRYNEKIARYARSGAVGQSRVGASNRIYAVIGDYRPSFHKRLHTLLADSTPGRFDMEPLASITSMLKEAPTVDNMPAIGGAPQLAKVYPSRTALPVAVYWDREGTRRVHLFGRPLMSYERTHYPIIDPVTMKVFYPLSSVTNDDGAGGSEDGLAQRNGL